MMNNPITPAEVREINDHGLLLELRDSHELALDQIDSRMLWDKNEEWRKRAGVARGYIAATLREVERQLAVQQPVERRKITAWLKR